MQSGHIGCKPVIADVRRHSHRACGPSETRACRNREVMRGLRIEPERERRNKSRIDGHCPDHKHADLPRLQAVNRHPRRLDIIHCSNRAVRATSDPDHQRAIVLAKAKRNLKWQRDPEGMRLRILEAAKQEFAAHGLAGARVDRIAANAGANKRMLYYHVGKKDDLYLAVLEGAYEKIRVEERGLDLEHLDPPKAIERLIDFTWNYFIRNPEFLALTEHRKSGAGASPQAIHQGQVDAFAVRRDDPHGNKARRRKRRLRGGGRSGAALHFDRGAVLSSICRTARRSA
jgi:AcrR family transcriptional regulator